MKSKICGITNLEDALLAANNGAWAIGFNFYKNSPRYVSFKKAREITSKLPKNIIKVGILIDYSKDEMCDALEFLDLIQIYPSQLNFRGCCLRDSRRSHIPCVHSCVSNARRLPEKSSVVGIYGPEVTFLDKSRFILAFQASSKNELPEHTLLQEYGYILLDAPKQEDELLGGTGRLSNWDLARELAKDYKLILAGGLNSSNVLTAIEQVRPFAVDVASGVEERPGIKNPLAVKEFIMGCQHVE
ncbi:MAG: phosphoribosylanthranilate isomerase [Gammaproteobacteria bacterium]